MTKRDLALRLKRRDELNAAISKLTADPLASESISTPNGGSRSVSYTQLTNLTTELRAVEREIDAYKASVLGGGSINYARYCSL